MKMSGKNLGILYPAQGPMVQLLGPKKFELAYKQLPVLPLPMPSLDSMLKDTSVCSQDRELIAANLLAAELTLRST